MRPGGRSLVVHRKRPERAATRHERRDQQFGRLGVSIAARLQIRGTQHRAAAQRLARDAAIDQRERVVLWPRRRADVAAHAEAVPLGIERADDRVFRVEDQRG